MSWQSPSGALPKPAVGQAVHRSRRTPRSARRKLPSNIRTPRFWLECVCFFLLATPFELAIGSGYVYAIKAAAGLILLLPRLASGSATLGGRIVWIAVLAISFLIVNMHDLTDRALFAFFLILIGAALGQLRSWRWDERLKEIVTVYLLFHLAGFGFSLVEFLLRGNVIDLHGILFPGASRAHEIGAAARVSGFHVEPGTYAQWMLMVTFLHCLLTGRIVSLLTGAVGVSMLMTFSLWAVVGVALLGLAAALDALFRTSVGQKMRVLGSVLLLSQAAAIALAYIPGIILEDGLAFLERKAEMRTDSGSDKLLAMAEIQEKVSDVIILGAPMNPGFCPYCLSPQDVGVWANVIYYFGLVPAVALFLAVGLFVIRGWGVSYIPFVAAMLLWKAVFYDPLLWMIIGYVLEQSARNNAARHAGAFYVGRSMLATLR